MDGEKLAKASLKIMNQVKLRYWMEQQVNINVYRVYVERPSELTDANLQKYYCVVQPTRVALA